MARNMLVEDRNLNFVGCVLRTIVDTTIQNFLQCEWCIKCTLPRVMGAGLLSQASFRRAFFNPMEIFGKSCDQRDSDDLGDFVAVDLPNTVLKGPKAG